MRRDNEYRCGGHASGGWSSPMVWRALRTLLLSVVSPHGPAGGKGLAGAQPSRRLGLARSVVSTLSVLCAVLLWGSASALAAAPVVESESFNDVGTTSVNVHATLNANGLPSSYLFEYGTKSGSYEASTPATGFGTGNVGVSVSAAIENLRPRTLYHFRVVATNEDGSTKGNDETLTTFPLTLGLPDERGFEMVTPAENQTFEVYIPIGTIPNAEGGEHGEGNNGIITNNPTQASSSGEAVVYAGTPLSEGNGSQGSGKGNEYLATRNPGGGWTQQAIQPKGYASPEFVAFSSNLELGVLISNEPLAHGVAEKYEIPYVHNNKDGINQPFFPAKPPHREPGEWGAAAVGGYYRTLGEYYAGASPDFKHQYFEANDALVSPAVDGGPRKNNLYESLEGQLHAVNVLPNGTSEPNASFGEPPEGYFESGGFDRAFSANGRRVFWTDLNTDALYVREDAVTTSLIAEHANFQTASVDGSKVLYTKAGDLYEENLETTVTKDLAPAGEVQGVLGASENLEYIYFVADAKLAEGAAVAKPNLYLLRQGVMTFIATLDGGEGFSYGNNEYGATSLWKPDIGYRDSEVTPSGLGLVFISGKSLTGYDNVIEATNSAVPEVYVYDAAGGQLSCASCDPSGERPIVPGFGGAGSFIPVGGHDTYQPRVISEDGDRVFFMSYEPLLPAATNGKANVYEWEQDGSGTCQRSGGCISLLSGGTSVDASYLIGASSSGDDVFLITRAQLSSEDHDEFFNVYDARVGVKPPPAEPRCTGTGCQGVPFAPPVFATPASETFNGVGNFPPSTSTPVVVKSKRKRMTRAQKLTRALKACKHEGKRKRAACERRARKSYGAGSRSSGRSKKGGRS